MARPNGMVVEVNDEGQSCAAVTNRLPTQLHNLTRPHLEPATLPPLTVGNYSESWQVVPVRVTGESTW